MATLYEDFPSKDETHTSQQQDDSSTNSNNNNNNHNNSINGLDPMMDMSEHNNLLNNNNNNPTIKLSQVIPEEYLYDPFNAEPTLDHLRAAAVFLESELDNANAAAGGGDGVTLDGTVTTDDDPTIESTNDDDDDDDTISNLHNVKLPSDKKETSTPIPKKKKSTSLETLLTAANQDYILHLSRIKAVLAQDPTLLQTYNPTLDPSLQQREIRLDKLQSHREDLQSQAASIVSSLNDDLDGATGGNAGRVVGEKDAVTRGALLQARLVAWEKALQLYIYCPPKVEGDGGELVDGADSALTTTNSASSPSSTSHKSVNTNTTSSNNNNNSNNNSNNKPTLSLLQLLHHLTLIAKQDEPLTTNTTEDDTHETTLTQTLSHAMTLCTDHLSTVSSFLSDSTEQSASEYQKYQIHLIAHSIASNRTLEKTESIQDSFLLHGREALKVGHALELAEAKRRQSERASVLLRRWWMMEDLAKNEEFSGEEIKVNEEIRGVITSSACRMDPLFTRVECSLEAAMVLRSLRMVVRCKSDSMSGATKKEKVVDSDEEEDEEVDNINKSKGENTKPPTNTATTGFMFDPQALERFTRTNHLITRTSNALEKRLLNAFSKIYTKGGTYDFTSTNAAKRNGRLDWVMLRECAEALMNFDGGRSLHQRFVDLVVTTKFPELFLEDVTNPANTNTSSEVGYVSESDGDDASPTNSKSMRRMNTEEQQEYDMDATRTKLSTLFHRVCEVCTEEFQLIAHVFAPNLPPHLVKEGGVGGGVGGGGAATGGGGKGTNSSSSTAPSSFSDTYPLHVARALLQRIISDPYKGMQAQINELLDGIDRRGDFDAGAKKLDTFVVIHEKAAGLFIQLKEAASTMFHGTAVRDRTGGGGGGKSGGGAGEAASSARSEAISATNAQSIASIIQFLTSQERALSSGQRRGYLNLELRLLHHECCANLDRIGAKFLKPIQTYSNKDPTTNRSLGLSLHNNNNKDKNKNVPTLVEYRAPIMPIDKDYLHKGGYLDLLHGPLKASVLRQPLIHATDSLARARLMFGLGQQGGEDIDSTARVILSIFMQMCNFYGSSYLFPIVESLAKMLVRSPPNTPPVLPFDENKEPHDLGVDENFWISIERIHLAAKNFDRELWAENRTGSVRVWEILVQTRSVTSLTLAKDRRIKFFQDLEERGEAVILRALQTLSAHIQWILVTGGENIAGASGPTNRLMKNFTGQSAGPYAVPTGSLLDSTNSPAVKALTFCLRSQFVRIQAALTPQSLSAFWTALSMRLYDILVRRLLLHYYVSIAGAVVLSRDVEALRTVAMLAGTQHSHWDNLRELLTLFMTPPDALRTMLVGADGDINSGKGMFGRVGKDQSIVFMSRRVDYRYKTAQGLKRSQWVIQLLEDLGINDPTEGRGNINIAPYAAENMMEKN